MVAWEVARRPGPPSLDAAAYRENRYEVVARLGFSPRAEAKSGGPKTCRGRAPGSPWGGDAEGKDASDEEAKGAKG